MNTEESVATGQEGNMKNCEDCEHGEERSLKIFTGVPTEPDHAWCKDCGAFKPSGAKWWLTPSMFRFEKV